MTAMKDLSEARRIVEQQRGEIERLKAELAVTNIEAARYRWLRDSMRFDSDPHGKHTMVFPYELAAPWHDFHKDWISERFTASVDKTVDAAIEQEQSK